MSSSPGRPATGSSPGRRPVTGSSPGRRPVTGSSPGRRPVTGSSSPTGSSPGRRRSTTRSRPAATASRAPTAVPAATVRPAATAGPAIRRPPARLRLPAAPRRALRARPLRPPRPGTDDNSMAMLAHLLGLLVSWIGPLIIYVMRKDQSPYVRDQAAEALNFQITMFIGYIVSAFLMLLFIGFLLLPAVFVVSLIFHIQAAMATYRGERYRYPISIRLIT
ncbi:DUF4870 domain-containing protein [Nonomuraea salmonea]|uniref:DUF4870 domain-containing protein n=1 Tax=Nonomuraea salmonea TaxID=46181 RepID=UPI003CD07F62